LVVAVPQVLLQILFRIQLLEEHLEIIQYLVQSHQQVEADQELLVGQIQHLVDLVDNLEDLVEEHQTILDHLEQQQGQEIHLLYLPHKELLVE
jgi:hypothetical protein